MISLTRFESGRRLLAVVGVQPLQYQLLVDLFGTLGERKELVGNLATDRQALRLASLFLLFPGLILGLIAFAPMSLATYEVTLLSISSAVLLLLLVTEASNSFLNPAEVSVLAHRPIQGSTYFAAKLTYLLVIVLRSELVLNGPAAVTGAFKAEARWFYPLTHLGAALGAGVFLALVACALFGVMMRVVPLSRLRAAAMWLQLVVSSLPVMFNLLRQPARALVAMAAPLTAGVDWSFVPVVWFAALGVAGQDQLSSPIHWPVASVGIAISAVFIALGVRALSAGYMTRIVAITRASRGVSAKSRFSLFGGAVASLTGSPAGRAGYEFVTRMMRRDWQFRRLMSQTAISIVLVIPVVFRGLRSASPFSGAAPSAISILPEFIGIFTLLVCAAIGFSDHHRASWIFGQMPDGALVRYLRGVLWSLWLLCGAIPVVLISSVLSRSWGLPDALLFGAYGLAVTAFLLAMQFFFVEGLPFGAPPKADRQFVLMPLILFGPITLGIAWIVQARLLFHSRIATGLVAVGIAAAAVLVARQTTVVVERRIGAELARRAVGGSVMFQATDES